MTRSPTHSSAFHWCACPSHHTSPLDGTTMQIGPSLNGSGDELPNVHAADFRFYRIKPLTHNKLSSRTQDDTSSSFYEKKTSGIRDCVFLSVLSVSFHAIMQKTCIGVSVKCIFIESFDLLMLGDILNFLRLCWALKSASEKYSQRLQCLVRDRHYSSVFARYIYATIIR